MPKRGSKVNAASSSAPVFVDLVDSDELPTRARNMLTGLLKQFVYWREAAEGESRAVTLEMMSLMESL